MIIKVLRTCNTYNSLSTIEAQIWGFSKHAQAQLKKGVAYKINKADRHKSRAPSLQRQTDRQTDRPTDRVAYRVARTRLKSICQVLRPFCFNLKKENIQPQRPVDNANTVKQTGR